jgi:hypothetical protein
VCDAGGSTVDTTSYKVSTFLLRVLGFELNIPSRSRRCDQYFRSQKPRDQPVCPDFFLHNPKISVLKSVCHLSGVQAGAIFVNQTAAEYFTKTFSSAGIEGPELRRYTQEALDAFEPDCKRRFRDIFQDDWIIEAGGHRFTNKSIGVSRGRMAVPRLLTSSLGRSI